MAKISSLIRVIGEGCDDVLHLPGATYQHETVCGFVDVKHEVVSAYENEPTCPECLSIVNELRNMRMPDGSLP